MGVPAERIVRDHRAMIGVMSAMINRRKRAEEIKHRLRTFSRSVAAFTAARSNAATTFLRRTESC